MTDNGIDKTHEARANTTNDELIKGGKKKVYFFNSLKEEGKDDSNDRYIDPVSSVMTIPNLADEEYDNMGRIWYVTRDFNNFKRNTKHIAKLGSKSNLNALLKNVFQYNKNNNNNNNAVTTTFSLSQSNDQKINTICCCPPQIENENTNSSDGNQKTMIKKKKKKKATASSSSVDPLMLWCQHAHTRRGIEKAINEKHGRDRQRRTRELIQSVLRRQNILKKIWSMKLNEAGTTTRTTKQKESRNNNGEQYYSNYSIIEKQLADLSLKHSKDATMFAQRMGAADATAVAFNNNDDKSSNIMDMPSQEELLASSIKVLQERSHHHQDPFLVSSSLLTNASKNEKKVIGQSKCYINNNNTKGANATFNKRYHNMLLPPPPPSSPSLPLVTGISPDLLRRKKYFNNAA